MNVLKIVTTKNFPIQIVFGSFIFLMLIPLIYLLSNPGNITRLFSSAVTGTSGCTQTQGADRNYKLSDGAYCTAVKTHVCGGKTYNCSGPGKQWVLQTTQTSSLECVQISGRTPTSVSYTSMNGVLCDYRGKNTWCGDEIYCCPGIGNWVRGKTCGSTTTTTTPSLNCTSGSCSPINFEKTCGEEKYCCIGPGTWVKGNCILSSVNPASTTTTTPQTFQPGSAPAPPEQKKGKTTQKKKTSSTQCNDFNCTNIKQGSLWGIVDCSTSDPDGDVQLCNAKGRVGQCGGEKMCCPGSGQQWTADLAACPVTQTTLLASPSALLAGQPLTVTWNNIPAPSSTDWIAMYKQGETDERNPTEWNFVNSANTCTKSEGDAKASGSCSFAISQATQTGTYELRLYTNDTYTKLATSNLFTITGTLTPTPLVSPTPSGTCCACPSPTPVYTQSACNGPCMTSFNCTAGQVCILSSPYGWVCRNPACADTPSCSCTGISVTPSTTPTPTLPSSVKLACGETCSSSSQCRTGYQCVYLNNQGISVCRNPNCYLATSCSCASLTPTGISKGDDTVSPTQIATGSGTPTPTGLRLGALPTPTPTIGTAPINPSLLIKPFTDTKGNAPQKFTLTGTSDPFTEIDIRFDPDSLGQTTTADADGNWRYILTKSLKTGTKDLTVTARSSDGGETQVKQSFTVKSGRSFFSLFIGFLFLAAIGGIGFFIYQKQMNDQSSLFSQFSPVTPEVTPETEDAEISAKDDQPVAKSSSDSENLSPEPFITPDTEISSSEKPVDASDKEDSGNISKETPPTST